MQYCVLFVKGVAHIYISFIFNGLLGYAWFSHPRPGPAGLPAIGAWAAVGARLVRYRPGAAGTSNNRFPERYHEAADFGSKNLGGEAPLQRP